MTITPIIFNANPFFAISIIFNLFVPKTIAFGGVATGNIKAMDPDKVAGNINSRGFTSVFIARPASIGSIISVVAVLDVSSVRKVIKRAIKAMIIIG